MTEHELLALAMQRILDGGRLKAIEALGIEAADLPDVLVITRHSGHQIVVALPEHASPGPAASLLSLAGEALMEAEAITSERMSQH